jgi:plasmid maintenance system antidote protein VapI
MKATHNGPAQALKEQTSLLHYNGSNIAFEQINGKMMINATQMAKPFGRQPVDWLNTQQAKDLIEVVAKLRKISLADIQHIKRGGNNSGTWFCEEVALFFAQWLSSEFYFACNDKLKELLSGEG